MPPHGLDTGRAAVAGAAAMAAALPRADRGTAERAVDLSAPLAEGEVLRGGAGAPAVPMYAIDSLVRRAGALQHTAEARRGREADAGPPAVERQQP